MANPLSAIPNQPVYLYDPATEVEDCLCEDMPAQLVNWGDITQFQLQVDPCPEAEPMALPEEETTVWTVECYPGCTYCFDQSSDGLIAWAGLLTTGFHYKMVIDAYGTNINFQILDALGGDITINEGSYPDGKEVTVYFTATTADLVIKGLANADFCITFEIYEIVPFESIYAYDCGTDATASTQITGYTISQDGIMTVSVDWANLSLTAGCYYIAIEPPCEDVWTLRTNCFKVGDFPCTMLINACHENDAFGFDFSNGFSPQVRIDAVLMASSPETEREKYTDSRGNRRAYFSNSRRKKTLRIGFEPEHIHDFLSLLLQFDHVYIDSTEYFVEDDEYQLIPSDDLPCLPQATLEVSVKQQKREASLCAEPTGSGCALDACAGEYEETEYDNDEYFTC